MAGSNQGGTVAGRDIDHAIPFECDYCATADLCAMSAVIVRESGRSSIPETLIIESRGRGVLDRPVKPDDDRFGCLKTESHLPAAS
jgi:hypothetical protein